MSSLRERMKARTKRSNQQGAKYLNLPPGLEFWKPKKGKNLINILPYIVTNPKHRDAPDAVVGEEWNRCPIRVHYSIGPDNQAVICPTTVGKRCPICEERERMLNDESYSKKETDDLRYKDRDIYAIVDEDLPERPVRIFEYSYHLFGKPLDKELATQSEERGNDDLYLYFDPDEGFAIDVRFDETSMGQGKPFLEASRIDFRERRKKITDEQLAKVPKLDDLFNVLPYDDLRAIFLDLGSDEPDEPRAQRPSRQREEEPPQERATRGERGRDDDPPARRPREDDEAPARRPREEAADEPARRPREDDTPRRGRDEEPAPRRARDEDAPRRTETPPAEEETPRRRERAEAATSAGEETPRRREPAPEPKAGGECPEGKPFGEADRHECCDNCPGDTWDACKEYSKSSRRG